jgi:antagonist of KipI
VAHLRVLQPGLSTTIQDLGRQRCLQMGIPTGGAADQYSHRLANAIAGNHASAATLEMMLLGASFEVVQACSVAVAGADMRFQINGDDARMGRLIPVVNGDVLTFSKARRGCFGYLAVQGGFDGAVVLGSRSTYVAGRLGGHFGRGLRRDDLLDAIEGSGGSGLMAGEELLDWPLQNHSLRFVRGPQTGYFTAAAYRAFTGDPYTVSPRSNRMAHRLTGPALELESIPRTGDTGSGPTDIVEDGNAIGAIQIAGGVEPICMGRDCPTTGAYAKIGCIVTPDVSRLAQMQPGDSFRFQEVSVAEAYTISREASTLMGLFSR